jgi:hypothetical protein
LQGAPEQAPGSGEVAFPVRDGAEQRQCARAPDRVFREWRGQRAGAPAVAGLGEHPAELEVECGVPGMMQERRLIDDARVGGAPEPVQRLREQPRGLHVARRACDERLQQANSGVELPGIAVLDGLLHDRTAVLSRHGRRESRNEEAGGGRDEPSVRCAVEHPPRFGRRDHRPIEYRLLPCGKVVAARRTVEPASRIDARRRRGAARLFALAAWNRLAPSLRFVLTWYIHWCG